MALSPDKLNLQRLNQYAKKLAQLPRDPNKPRLGQLLRNLGVLKDPGLPTVPNARAPDTSIIRSPELPSSRKSTNPTGGAHVNKKQKTVLIAAAAAVVGMLIFPPFQIQIPGDIARSLGYALIFDPPEAGTVDIGLLMTQWLGVLIVGGIAFFLSKD